MSREAVLRAADFRDGVPLAALPDAVSPPAIVGTRLRSGA